MGNFGRIEARYTVPTGGWSVSATNSGGGPTTCTVAAGTYYATALATALQTALNASRTPATWTVTVGSGDGGTGLVTISHGSANFSIAWTTTNLRDSLGFTANFGPVSSPQISTSALKGLWLPDSPIVLPNTDTVGHYVSDLRQTVSPTGEVYSLVGNTYRQWASCRWTHVGKTRVLGTTTSPMNWEQFVFETQLGGRTYFPPGARFALYSNADASTLIGYFSPVGIDGTGTLQQAVQGWAGRWTVTIPRLISQSA